MRPFTLVEIMIALTIVALISGVVGVSVSRFYREQETLDEMGRVASLLRNAQELMMVAHVDSEVKFQKGDQDTQVTLTLKSSAPEPPLPLFNRGELHLTRIEKLSFDDSSQESGSRLNWSLFFFSKGFVMNTGILKMEGNGVTRSIVFHGYPAPLVLESGTPIFLPYASSLLQELESMTEWTRRETSET